MKEVQPKHTHPEASRKVFGYLPDGCAVEAITLRNRRRMSVTVIAYGAGIQAVSVPDRDGVFADVALGHTTIEPYLEQPQFIGSTVGRVANRIAGGRFTLDEQEYHAPINDGPNALHGGPCGFDKGLWDVIEVRSEPDPLVRLALVSPDGDQGFPGTLRVTATFSLDESNALTIEYRAQADRTTLVNLTNHAYWNLAGEGAAGGAMDHILTIPADRFLPTDASAIPTGEMCEVAGTPFDFRHPIAIGARVRDGASEQIRIGRGYDHNWVIATERSPEPRLLARLDHPGSGRNLEVLSTEPGLQFYSGNFLNGNSIGKAGQCYRMGDGIALEPQMFPDTANKPAFGSIRLDPNGEYRHVLVFRFSAG